MRPLQKHAGTLFPPHSTFRYTHLRHTLLSISGQLFANLFSHATNNDNAKKEQFMLFSNHQWYLLEQQPGFMTIDHSQKGKGKSWSQGGHAYSVRV